MTLRPPHLPPPPEVEIPLEAEWNPQGTNFKFYIDMRHGRMHFEATSRPTQDGKTRKVKFSLSALSASMLANEILRLQRLYRTRNEQ